MRYLVTLAGVLASLVTMASLDASPADKTTGWGPLQSLVGDWIGEGGGGPGQGAGSFSFKPGLQGKILLRKNRAEYPAAKERAAFVHDDLMVVYRDSPEAALRAIYFDSEGHTIRYDVQAAADGGKVVFVSAPEASAPRYRLTYTRVDQGHLRIKFEIAPPGKPEEFSTYIEAGARRPAE
ncbi:MAG TPA: hypothetical protein VN924_06875 [Bryobacteraceae bacterium]|nr:hypothetical protein [Bryobacteraceae bacterium]